MKSPKIKMYAIFFLIVPIAVLSKKYENFEARNVSKLLSIL